MKTRYIWIMAMAVVALTGCQKERVNGNLELIAEGMNGNTKLAINGLQSYWVDGESVRINDKINTITVNAEENGKAYVDSDDEVTAPYCGVYPASIYSSNAGTDYVLDLPASYIYATTTFNSQTVQNLASPMVAYATGNATSLFFKHVTAAIGVQVKNYHDYAITVDQITLSSNSYKLNGSVAVSFDDDIDVDPQTTDNDSEKTVTMYFGGQSGATLMVPAGGSAIVQVPVLPVGDDNKFTVSIQVSKTAPAVTATLTRTQTTGGALGRANLGYAMYTIGGPFSVSASKKVVFSKGNLQYNPYANTWQFAANQYDYIGDDNANIADNYNGWIDLFGWGTGNNPTNTSTTAGDYNSFNDWGAAAASNIGNGWYTLSKDEWTYLTTGSRSNVTFNLPATGDKNQNIAKYIKATITVSGNNYTGLIVFPDYYVQPDGVTMGTNTATYNGIGSGFSQYVVSSGWEKMEFVGAVFLPLTGYRNGTTVDQTTSYAYYWSSTKASATATSAYSLYFINSSLNAANNWTNAEVYKGHSVRLVRDVQ